MAKSKVFINKFQGIVNAIDPAIIGIQGSTDLENYSLVNGVLQPTEGTTRIGTACTSNQLSVLGANYLRGISTLNVETEKILIFAKTPNTIQSTLFDAAGTSPSFSTTALSFSTAPTYTNNEWQTIVYDNKVIGSNKSEVYTLDYGNSTQWQIASRFEPIIGVPSNIGVSNTGSFPKGFTWTGMSTYATSGNDSLMGLVGISFTNLTTGIGTVSKTKPKDYWYGTEANYTNSQNRIFYTDNSKIVKRYGHQIYARDLNDTTDSATRGVPVDISLKLWSNDFDEPTKTYLKSQRYNDYLYLAIVVSKSYSSDWTNPDGKVVFPDLNKFKITFYDNANQSFTPETKAQLFSNSADKVDRYVICADSSKKDKFDLTSFDWTNISYIQLDGQIKFPKAETFLGFTFGGYHNAECFDLQVGNLGGVHNSLTPIDSQQKTSLTFATVRYTPSTGEVSQPHNIITITQPQSFFDGVPFSWANNVYSDLPNIGRHLYIQYPISGTSSTESWLVVNDAQNPSAWRKVGFTTNPGTGIAKSSFATYYYNSNDVIMLPDISTSRSYISNAACMCSYQGWVVWGADRIQDNIRHSKIGNPIELANTNPNKTNADGADYTMSESYSDKPVAMASNFDTLYIWGSEGVYVQSGSYPSQLTPVRKVASLPGICGQFAMCKINDPILGQGMIYVSKDASRAYFIYADARFNNVSYRATEMTESIRDTFKSYLTETSSDLTKIRVTYRPDNDSIIIANGRNAWIFTRTDILSGKRQIIKRKLSDADMSFNFFTMPINSSGTVLPLFCSTGIGTTQTLFKFDPSVYTDNGKSITSKWTSGILYSPNQNLRMANIWVDRLTNNAPVGVAVSSTRTQLWNGTISTSTSNLPVNFKVQGYKFQTTFTQVNSATSGIQNFWVEMTGTIAPRQEKSNI